MPLSRDPAEAADIWAGAWRLAYAQLDGACQGTACACACACARGQVVGTLGSGGVLPLERGSGQVGRPQQVDDCAIGANLIPADAEL